MSFLNLYKKYSEAKNFLFVCSRIFTLAKFSVRPDFNIEANHLKF